VPDLSDRIKAMLAKSGKERVEDSPKGFAIRGLGLVAFDPLEDVVFPL
jgi:hypothetical protein